ncbi:DUF6879 family protein [Streptomyces sp. NPDC086023]|uniref:DUF6879 family protein n=1 Tax=Streptomyces sp. NPDC086023 TaxID=3365746 RepID=UPI0037D62D34
MLLDGEEWAAKFRTFQREAWRLETLPQYLVPQEAEGFAAFKAGARFPGPYEDSWTGMVRKRAATGGSVRRVHILTRGLVRRPVRPVRPPRPELQGPDAAADGLGRGAASGRRVRGGRGALGDRGRLQPARLLQRRSLLLRRRWAPGTGSPAPAGSPSSRCSGSSSGTRRTRSTLGGSGRWPWSGP